MYEHKNERNMGPLNVKNRNLNYICVLFSFH